MADTSIRVSDELADELYERKGRSTSYEDYIWQLLDEVDGAGDQEIETVDPAKASAFGDALDDAWEDFSDDRDDRRQARVGTLQAALAAVKREPLSKSEIEEQVYNDEVPGQNAETWFRRTVRPYLSEVAEYSNSDKKWYYSG